ncbi:tol-pal system-associated acyl-CoA thioesterase [Gilvimarinus algae]|uniref:Tol-pal system-associated acyl-CoA thioesterase n=1 Tax=Gilvimarinus algae TaxID=3058037 RepID=A0ABT8TDX7_9GAMM|nr:tol-pal system-associated acyl-CoA thioesterase [Gilvimarinus sp. SDUM040014]MDO3382116.1 tol-pal system-associated acyl-CoA thioesterase [Gilvimarinus sp. SDUM040014]
MSAETFALPVRVYIEDTDAGGIVYYVNYLKFMERSRTEFLRQYGYDKPAILDDGQLLVVHSAQVSYKKPARLDDLLRVTTEVHALARTNVVFCQRVLRGNELLCEGLIRVACVLPDTMKPCAMPAAMREQLADCTITDKS